MSDMHDLHALADGQLNGEQEAQVRERLKTCHVSQAEYQAILQLKQTVGCQCKGISNTEEWAKCRARMDELDRAKKVNTFVGRHAWGLAAAVGLILVSAHVTNRITHKYDVSSGEASASFMGSRAVTPAVDAEGQAIIGNRVLRVPRGSFEIKSMKQGLLEGQPTTLLNLQYGNYPMEFMAIEGAGTDQAGFSTEPGDNGTTAVKWTDGNTLFLLVGPQGPREITGVAEKLSQLVQRR